MNDLIGLKMRWGARVNDGSGYTDCLSLAAEVHKRLGYYDYSHYFDWVFETYTQQSFPKTFIAKWLLKNGVRLKAPKPHAIVLLPSNSMGALGTVMDDGQVLFITESSGVVLAPLPAHIGHYFWLNK